MPTASHIKKNMRQQSTAIIQPHKRLSLSDFSELWQYRDLLWTLSIRDVQIRYKQSLLGASWAIIQPLATSGVATIVFGKILGLANGSLTSYFLEVYPAMILWTLFAAIINAASGSLINNAGMLSKVYFPRLVFPISAVFSPLLDSIIASLVLIGFMLIKGHQITASFILLPILLTITILIALGIGILLAALTAVYRDFKIIIPFMMQLLFFLTPILYKLELSDNWLKAISLNPMYGIITNLKNIFSNQSLQLSSLSISCIIAAICIYISVLIFSKIERKFADII